MAAMGMLAIAAAGYLAVMMPEAGFESPRLRAGGAPRPARTGTPSVRRTSAWGDAVKLWKQGARLVRRNPSLLAVTLSAAIAAGAWEANDRLSALRLVDLGRTELDGREAVLFFGAAWFVMSALAIPMMMWLHRRLDQADQRSARRDALLLARFLTVAAVGALALALSPWFTVALIGWAVLDVAGETAYSLTEAMAKAGERAGLPSGLSRSLARETVAGAAALMAATDDDPAQLRADVTSPGGTTEAALRVLMDDERWASRVDRAVAAAAARSRELAAVRED